MAWCVDGCHWMGGNASIDGWTSGSTWVELCQQLNGSLSIRSRKCVNRWMEVCQYKVDVCQQMGVIFEVYH